MARVDRRNTVSGRTGHTFGLRGLQRSLTVMTFIELWAMYRVAEHGDPVNIEELASALGRSPASLYSWQADFRKVFDEFGTPGELLDELNITTAITVRGLRDLPLPKRAARDS